MLRPLRHPTGLLGLRSPALEALGVPHLFTTRVGPAGEFCVRRVDEDARVLLADAAGADRDARLVRLRQVHGAHVVEVGPTWPTPDDPGDALVTGAADALLMVRTADCVPVLVAADGGRRVAAVHAGWRGLLAGAIPAALEHLGAPPEAAAIGPCLSLARCEMGPEVATRFVDAGLGTVVHPGPRDRSFVDVRAAAAVQLERAGCAAIDVSLHCTWDDAQLFHSHRREVTHGSRVRAGSLGALVAVAR